MNRRAVAVALGNIVLQDEIADALALQAEVEVVACRTDAELLVLLTATDETVSEGVHSRSSYQADEIVWGAKFVNMFKRSEVEGIVGMNLNRIHDIEPVLSS